MEEDIRAAQPGVRESFGRQRYRPSQHWGQEEFDDRDAKQTRSSPPGH